MIVDHGTERNEKLRHAQANKLLRFAEGLRKTAAMAKRPISKAASGFGDRLRAVRMDAGYADAAAFAREIGVEPPAYRKWERGQAEPAYAYLDRIQEITRCSLDWLITGKVPRFETAA